MNGRAIAWNLGLVGAGVVLALTFSGAKAAPHSPPVSGYSLMMEVSVDGDVEGFAIDTGMRRGDCVRAARSIKPSYRVYRGIDLSTVYTCKK